jgi:hypothetical protein
MEISFSSILNGASGNEVGEAHRAYQSTRRRDIVVRSRDRGDRRKNEREREKIYKEKEKTAQREQNRAMKFQDGSSDLRLTGESRGSWVRMRRFAYS